MAVRDHTAPARLPAPPGGTTPATPPEAPLSAACEQAPSPYLSTLDEITIAVFTVSKVLECSECFRKGKWFRPDGLVTRPFSPLFVEGMTLAIRCLEQYAETLGRKPDAGA
nr:hypothetical protein [Dyella sp. ASV24]